MPIGPFEREVLQVLAAHRNPESYVAGATVLHRSPGSPRASRDVDIFHDTIESLRQSVATDLAVLRRQGYAVTEVLIQPTIHRVTVHRGRQATKIEWAHDSAFRFFPVEPDPDLGWRLNFWDAATNKVLALVGRHEFRDYVDVLYLHQHHLHLGALAWAAAGKDPGLTPEFIVDWTRRSTRYSPAEIAEAQLAAPPDLGEMKRALLQAAEEAEALFSGLPPAEMGCLYLSPTGQPVVPDPALPQFSQFIRHFGSVRGAWPTTAE